MHIYVYIYTYICIYFYVYIYIYTICMKARKVSGLSANRRLSEESPMSGGEHCYMKGFQGHSEE